MNEADLLEYRNVVIHEIDLIIGIWLLARHL